MNFVVAFIMLVNGGNEKEAFWLFAAMTKTSNNSGDVPRFQGLKGFYKEHFPLLFQYFYQFDHLFELELPELYAHFQEQSVLHSLWL